MKVSRDWLQTFFEQPLPDSATLAEALTFHAFEIESVENDILDVKVTANRGHDCLCHRGIAKELAAILDLPIKNDDLRQRAELSPKTDAVTVEIEDPVLCPRYIAGYIRGVKVAPSPAWLQARLSSIGQRPINNIVDATNYVMFRLGQPLHAFDAGKLASSVQRRASRNIPKYKIRVRNARGGEKMTTLDDKEYLLNNSNLLIVDGNSDKPIGIAGIKGGKPSGIDDSTVNIIIESANFHGPSIRKTAAALKLRTDASSRYEQEISPWLAVYGMRAVVELILEIAGGEVIGFSQDYALAPEKRHVVASLPQINAILGTHFSSQEVVDVLARLDLSHIESNGVFDIQVPFERLDLTIPEDIAEEVGRTVGYDKIVSTQLPSLSTRPDMDRHFYISEQVREDFISKGYSEVYTSVFSESGERAVLNKADSVRPYLRTTLMENLADAQERNRRNKNFLQLEEVKLFEIGRVWLGREGKETTMVGIADEKGIREMQLEEFYTGDTSLIDAYESFPLSQTKQYQSFSKYPFIVRDIALWVSKGTTPDEVLKMIHAHAGELLVKTYLFDRFEKGEKTSLAFRLVFQSFDRTLTDFDANERLESVAAALKEKGFEVR